MRTSLEDLIKRLLQPSPAQRAAAREAWERDMEVLRRFSERIIGPDAFKLTPAQEAAARKALMAEAENIRRVTEAMRSGAMSVNEARAIEGMPPVPPTAALRPRDLALHRAIGIRDTNWTRNLLGVEDGA